MDLENQLLQKAEAEGKKRSVFAGPVFSSDDEHFDNGGRIRNAVQIPQSFWKVIVWNDPEKGLCSESYLMSQSDDLRGNSSFGRYEKGADLSTYRVPLQQIEELSGLQFPSLRGADSRTDLLRTPGAGDGKSQDEKMGLDYPRAPE